MATEELKLLVAVGTNFGNLGLLSLAPDFVEVVEKLIHQRCADLGGALVAEVVSHLECLLGHPVFKL